MVVKGLCSETYMGSFEIHAFHVLERLCADECRIARMRRDSQDADLHSEKDHKSKSQPINPTPTQHHNPSASLASTSKFSER